MRIVLREIQSGAAVLIVALAGASHAVAAEQAIDPRLSAACETMHAQLVAAGRSDIADELVRQFEQYERDPAYRDDVHRAVAERMHTARREFARRYAQLVAEGRQADASRLLGLFTAYVKGTP